MIHCKTIRSQTKEEFSITFVYGENEEAGREVLWRNIKEIGQKMVKLWLVVGDFNDILAMEERIGRRKHRRLSTSFLKCVNSCGLEDMKSSGCYYTWNNKQQGEARVCSKIDRTLVNKAWCDTFVNVGTVFLPEGNFDHSPILVTFYPDMGYKESLLGT